MTPMLYGILILLVMVTGMLGLLEFGRRLGARRRARDPEAAKAGAGAVDGAVFGLMGLLIAFTFSGAAARFDTRRLSAVAEANAIGTAWLRLDLLPATAQPPLRERFRRYVEARLAAFHQLPDLAAAKSHLDRAAALQADIWAQAVAACRDAGSVPTTTLLLPALNEMFDAATSRTLGAQMHPPPLIYAMLGLLVLAGALLAGYGMGAADKARYWFHAFAFVIVLSLAIYVILDFEFPRIGLIRIDAIDQLFLDLQAGMPSPRP
jgi:hypothetical protein